MTKSSSGSLRDFLEGYVSSHKQALIQEKLDDRTRFITVVLEDIYNSHNASAVIRTCDCFGIQDLHVVEDRNEYSLNPGVTQGSSKWVDLHRHNEKSGNNIASCYQQLQQSGYEIVATTPDTDSVPLDEFEMSRPFALVFGTEMEGLTDFAIESADRKVHIPMKGFTSSFNISVSAAICLYELTRKMRASGVSWRLTDSDREEITLRWYRKVVRNAEALEKEFRDRHLED